MTDKWYYQVMGATEGPVSRDQLQTRAQDGDITPETLVREGEGEWMLADRVPRMFDSSGGAIREAPKPKAQAQAAEAAAGTAGGARSSTRALAAGVVAVALIAAATFALKRDAGETNTDVAAPIRPGRPTANAGNGDAAAPQEAADAPQEASSEETSVTASSAEEKPAPAANGDAAGDAAESKPANPPADDPGTNTPKPDKTE